ncbi:diguanylate cyclase domain-containing protein [Oceanospirillum sp.]|uniref:GGDEF domain-containing protein n=1 Tax=Oceanospirillum sp. TaxID=2021254 RepID=UPI003A91168F
MQVKEHIDQLLYFLLGSKLSPYQHTHHAVLLVGGFSYLACSIFNFVFQTADVILSYAQFGFFLLIMWIWFRSRFRNEYQRMALAFMFFLILIALPMNWIYNAGLAGPTYFLNLCVLGYICVAFRDFGIYLKVGIALIILLPLLMVWLDLIRPDLIYAYPSDLARALDLSFSFVVTAFLLLIMMRTYSRRYRLERDKAEYLADQLRNLSELDPLTGLHNRRGMDRYMDKLERSGALFTQTILDLDHFKALNDRYGHSYGDEVLCHFAKLLNHLALTNKGLAVRLGGEEFVLILPMSEAMTLSEIQKLALELQSTQPEKGGVTFSAGVAECVTGEEWEDLLARADQLMYAAKKAGRNRVFAASFEDNKLAASLEV